MQELTKMQISKKYSIHTSTVWGWDSRGLLTETPTQNKPKLFYDNESLKKLVAANCKLRNVKMTEIEAEDDYFDWSKDVLGIMSNYNNSKTSSIRDREFSPSFYFPGGTSQSKKGKS